MWLLKRIRTSFYSLTYTTSIFFSPLKVEKGFPDSILYKHDLYRAYIEICHPEDQQHLKMVRWD